MSSEFPVRNIKSGVQANLFMQSEPPTHWKAKWEDRRGPQERLYNKIGPAKAQRTHLKRYNIEVQVIPCILVELDPI